MKIMLTVFGGGDTESIVKSKMRIGGLKIVLLEPMEGLPPQCADYESVVLPLSYTGKALKNIYYKELRRVKHDFKIGQKQKSAKT